MKAVTDKYNDLFKCFQEKKFENSNLNIELENCKQKNKLLETDHHEITEKYNHLYSLVEEEKNITASLQDEIKDYEKKNEVLEREKSELSDKLERLRKALS